MHSTRKTWFITGASSGFGHAYASRALACGADAVAAVRAHAETLVADLSGWAPIANDTRLGAFQEIRP